METLPAEIIDQILETFPAEYGPPTGTPQNRAVQRKVAGYSTICRAWRDSIERLTFKSLRICTDELDTFSALFSGANISRRAALSTLNVYTILPDPGNAIGCCDVTRVPDRNADGIAFSAAVVKLFTILADVNLRAKRLIPPPLSIVFSQACRSSIMTAPRASSRKVPCSPPVGHYRHSRREVSEAQAASGEFEMVCSTEMPVVPDVQTLDFRHSGGLSALKLTCIPDVVWPLSDLEQLVLLTEDHYHFGRLQRKARRTCLSQSICSLAGCHLKHVRLFVWHQDIENETLPVHNFIDHGQWSQEAWAVMFLAMASFPNLEILQLHGCFVICPEFFRTITEHPDVPFPALNQFELQFSPETADGRWFFERDNEALKHYRRAQEPDDDDEEEVEEEEEEEESSDDEDGEDGEDEESEDENEVGEGEDGQYESASTYDSTDESPIFGDHARRIGVAKKHRFRSLPAESTFLPFLINAAEAIPRLPNLQRLIIKLGHYFSTETDLDYFPAISRVFELSYLKAGMPQWGTVQLQGLGPYLPGDRDYVFQNRLYWRVDRWKPWDDVQSAWEKVVGHDAKIAFLKESEWKLRRLDSGVQMYVYEAEI